MKNLGMQEKNNNTSCEHRPRSQLRDGYNRRKQYFATTVVKLLRRIRKEDGNETKK